MPAASIVLGLLVSVSIFKGIEAEELKNLQGKWRIVAVEVGSEKHTVDPKESEEAVTIRGARWIDMPADKLDDVRISLNPLAEPKQINFTFTKWGSFSSVPKERPVTCLGIYSLKGDTLKICYDIPFAGPANRPTKFTGKPDSTFLTYKRVK